MAADAPGSTEPGASARRDVLDLDMLRAQRLEVTERVIRFAGREYRLLPEIPFELAEQWHRGRRMECFRLLFCDDAAADEFFAAKPSWPDVNAIIDSYGTTPGKSSAS